MVDVAVFSFVAACWIVLGAGFIVSKPPGPRPPDARRGAKWKRGLLLQALAVGVVWLMPRSRGHAIIPADSGLQVLLTVLTVVLAAGSVWLMIWAKRTLGRQWAYQARLVEGHKLITRGPYRLVRHPIYFALFTLGIATALAHSRPIALVLFCILYAWGTAIRVRAEEQLLRSEFPQEYAEYAARVRAFIPGIL